MMVQTLLHGKLNNSLCTKCAETVTKTENSLDNPHVEKVPHKKFYGNMTDYEKLLKALG